MKSKLLILFCIAFLTACSNNGKLTQEEKSHDSLEKKELDQVDDMLLKSDSMMKAKEKEILEQYQR